MKRDEIKDVIMNLSDEQKVEFAVRYSLKLVGDLGIYTGLKRWLEIENRPKNSFEEIVQGAALNAFEASGLGTWKIPQEDWINFYTLLTIDYMIEACNQHNIISIFQKMNVGFR
jgi:hypothetical protein